MEQIKQGDAVLLPCGAEVRITSLSKGLVGIRIHSERGIYAGEEDTDHLPAISFNFWPDNIRTLIETLERIEKAVCPKR